MEPMAIADHNKTQVSLGNERLELTRTSAIVRMRFDLHWESETGYHTDCLIAAKLNLWRDIFPPELERQIMDKPVGYRARHSFAPGELLANPQENRLHTIPNNRFNRRFMRNGLVEPRVGRFYPKGILEGVPGIFRMDRLRARLREVRGTA